MKATTPANEPRTTEGCAAVEGFAATRGVPRSLEERVADLQVIPGELELLQGQELVRVAGGDAEDVEQGCPVGEAQGLGLVR